MVIVSSDGSCGDRPCRFDRRHGCRPVLAAYTSELSPAWQSASGQSNVRWGQPAYICQMGYFGWRVARVLQWARGSGRRLAWAASSARVEVPSLAKMWERWTFTVPREMNMRSPIWGLVSPSATSSMTLSSVGVRLSHPRAGRLRSPRARRIQAIASSNVRLAPSSRAACEGSGSRVWRAARARARRRVARLRHEAPFAYRFSRGARRR